MKYWSEKFLQSVSQSSVMAQVSKIQPTCSDFEAKLNRLRANIILSDKMDRDEFDGIFWERMCDKSTERQFLNKLYRALEWMALTPMGKDILSGVCSSTYFGVAPMNLTGQFFDRSFPTVFLKASDDVFGNNKLILKILVHECTHAKNVRVEEKAGAYLLPSRLRFMGYMMNELSAYLSEDIVTEQKKNNNMVVGGQTQQRVFDILDRLMDSNYVACFSNRVIRWHQGDMNQLKNKTFSQKHLPLFAYYFSTYPVLCHISVINRLYQLYNHHVVKKVHRQMNFDNTQRNR